MRRTLQPLDGGRTTLEQLGDKIDPVLFWMRSCQRQRTHKNVWDPPSKLKLARNLVFWVLADLLQLLCVKMSL